MDKRHTLSLTGDSGEYASQYAYMQGMQRVEEWHEMLISGLTSSDGSACALRMSAPVDTNRKRRPRRRAVDPAAVQRGCGGWVWRREGGSVLGQKIPYNQVFFNSN